MLANSTKDRCSEWKAAGTNEEISEALSKVEDAVRGLFSAAFIFHTSSLRSFESLCYAVTSQLNAQLVGQAVSAEH